MVYFFENYDGFSCEKYLDFLSPDRSEKYERLKQKRDKENCVISFLLLRKALSDYGINSFETETGENGKPFIKGNNNIHFNISHTGGGVAVAVDNSPVGIDIQDILPVRDGVIERCFSDGEKQIVLKSNSPDRSFTRLWTLKESAIKCNSETVASLKNYCFENTADTFEMYGRKFTTFERKNLFISVCGDRDFSEIKEIRNMEEII